MDGITDSDGVSARRAAMSARARGPERRVATVLFADIVDSTKRFDDRDLEEASRELQQLVGALAAAVRRFKGTVAQEMGDGVMCLFGAPVAEEEHALQAARAGLEIVRSAAEAVARGLPPFAVRVGVASGEVLLQPVENGMRNDMRVLGPCVNLAAKLQQAASAGQVLLAASTAELIGDAAQGERVESGYGDGRAFALTAVAAGRRTALELMSNAAAGPIFGRDDELAQLRRAAAGVAAGKGAHVVITGEAGIGKSRLTGEFLQSPELAGWAVTPWPQSAERRLGAGDSLETLAEQSARSAGHPGAVCRAAEDASGGLARAALEACYGLPVTDARWTGLDPAQQRAFLSEGLAAALGELSQDRPLALVVEDAHWADGDAVRLLREVLAGLDDTHVLVLTTWRGDADAAVWSGVPAARLRLDRLNGADVGRYLDHWLGGDPALDTVKTQVAQKSEGVPLYLEESLRCLENDGVIGGEPGAYRLLRADQAIRLAPNVRGLIESRIGALSPAAARILEHAAVIGPSFHLPLLAALSPGRGDAVTGALARLTAGGFLTETTDGNAGERSFRHGLYQEVAYATLPQDKRRNLHARVLGALRRAVSKDLPGRIDQLARHAPAAEDWGRAYVYARAAGRAAERQCRHERAAEHYGRAREALARLPDTRRRTQRQIDLLTAQPLALLPQGGRGADELLLEAQALATKIDDRPRRAVAASILGSFRWAYGDIDEAIMLARQALTDAVAGGRPAREIPFRVRLGGILADKGHYRAAAAELRPALRLFRTVDGTAAAAGDRRCGLTLYADVAVMAFASPAVSELSGPAAGRRAAQLAYDWATSGEHLFTQLVAGHFLGRACLEDDDPQAAAALMRQSLDLAESIRCRIYQPLSMAILGLAQTLLGDDGRDLVAAGGGYAERLGVRRHQAKIRIIAARTALLTGAPAAAVTEATAALECAAVDRQDGDVAAALAVRVEALTALGRFDAAQADAARLTPLCRDIGAETTAARVAKRRSAYIPPG